MGPRIMFEDRISAAVSSIVLSGLLQNGNLVCTDGLMNRPTKPDEIWKTEIFILKSYAPKPFLDSGCRDAHIKEFFYRIRQ
jgi:hypothetical protein